MFTEKRITTDEPAKVEVSLTKIEYRLVLDPLAAGIMGGIDELPYRVRRCRIRTSCRMFDSRTRKVQLLAEFS